MLVRVRPCSSRALCLLGTAQLALYDCQTAGADAVQLLEDAKQSFYASIALEGAPAASTPRPELTGLVSVQSHRRLLCVLPVLGIIMLMSLV